MKTLIATLILLCGLAFGQTPITLGGSPSSVTVHNNTQTEILAYVLVFGGNYRFEHDHYFQPAGLLPETTANIGDFPGQGEVKFVQFVDGTEWGDHAIGARMLGYRAPLIAFDAELIEAYKTGTMAKFLQSAANDPSRSSIVRATAYHFIELSGQTNEAGAIAHLQQKLAAAAEHGKVIQP